MRILILATPRSGSTSLVRLVNSHITIPNYKMLIEPFNSQLSGYQKNIDSIVGIENILIKNLFLVGNDEYPIDSFINVYEYFNWCYSFFDKIILLDRKDKIAQSESFTINETMWREKGLDWHTPKIYDVDKIEEIEKYIEYRKIGLNFYGIKMNGGLIIKGGLILINLVIPTLYAIFSNKIGLPSTDN